MQNNNIIISYVNDDEIVNDEIIKLKNLLISKQFNVILDRFEHKLFPTVSFISKNIDADKIIVVLTQKYKYTADNYGNFELGEEYKYKLTEIVENKK